MITTSTTLILGAGASVAFGYPIGDKLRERILTTIEKGNGLYTAAIEVGFTPENIESFAVDFADSQRRTIDDFLEHRNDYLAIGRFAIAHELTIWENLRVRNVSRDSWPHLLLHKLGSHLTDIHNNRLHVATFNYDRALEQYFYQALKALHGNHPDPVGVSTTLAHAFWFLHIHGMLSTLPWQTGTGRPYQLPEKNADILEASRNILFTHTRFDTEPTWPDERSLSKVLAESKRVYFLGFGFADANLKKLRLDHVRNRSDISFGASAVDLSDETKGRVREHIPAIQFFDSIEQIIEVL